MFLYGNEVCSLSVCEWCRLDINPIKRTARIQATTVASMDFVRKKSMLPRKAFYVTSDIRKQYKITVIVIHGRYENT